VLPPLDIGQGTHLLFFIALLFKAKVFSKTEQGFHVRIFFLAPLPLALFTVNKFIYFQSYACTKLKPEIGDRREEGRGKREGWMGEERSNKLKRKNNGCPLPHSSEAL